MVLFFICSFADWFVYTAYTYARPFRTVVAFDGCSEPGDPPNPRIQANGQCSVVSNCACFASC